MRLPRSHSRGYCTGLARLFVKRRGVRRRYGMDINTVVFQIKCRSFSYLLMKSISSASKLRQWQVWRTEICAAKIRKFSRISEKSAASAK